MDSEEFKPTAVSRTACMIVSKMPHHKKIRLHLSDREWEDPALRVKLRDSFASSLFILPQSTSDFILYCPRRVPKDHPSSIFSLLENLERFSASGSFEMDIVEPSYKSLAAKSVWPKMTSYEICLLAITPSGQWLAIRHTESPNTDTARAGRWEPPSEVSRTNLSSFAVNDFRGPVDPEYAHYLVSAYTILYSNRKVEPCMIALSQKPQRPKEEMLRIWRRVAQGHDQKFDLM
ncbi:Vegetative incompatibility protein HET-E-1 [Fusarium oxysporum f. sp. albedinis]|nr:Vegetative incompatibility protein HET-E-1 [Fusarium oxysporum f. sp. albedinis]